MDSSQFKQLFLPCHRKLFTVAFRLTGNAQEAEDLVQDALLRLWTKREDLRQPENAEAFAVTTLRHLFYDTQRKKHLHENDEEPQEYQLRTDRNAADELEGQQQLSLLHRAIEALPQQQRLVITMHDVEDLSYEEIEKKTGLSQGNIRVALSRARKAVREQISKFL